MFDLLLKQARLMNGRFAWHNAVNTVLPMVTTTPASTLGLKNYGLEVGCEANIVVLDCDDWHGAIQFQPNKRYVILKGKLVAESKQERFLNL